MNLSNLQKLYQAALKRERIEALIDDLHSGQKRFIFAKDDHGNLSRFVGLLSARRFGKTSGYLMYAAHRCATVPKTRAIIIYQQLRDARDIAWPLLVDICDNYHLDARLYTVELCLKFHNGSILKLYGADDESRFRSFRGQRNDLVCIDEAQSYYSDLGELVRLLLPGLSDRRGRIFAIGTPGNNDEHWFHKLTIRKQFPEWTICRGDPRENPYTKAQLDEQIEILKRANPDIESEPWVKREYFGVWEVDSRHSIISLKPELNYLYDWSSSPDDNYAIGVDYGDKCTAFVVATWNAFRHPNLIFLESSTIEGGLVSDYAARINHYKEKYPGALVVSDPGGIAKALVRELNEVYGIGTEIVDKSDRIGQIAILQTDVSLGHIKIYSAIDPKHPETNPLAMQWKNLTWIPNPRTGRMEEGKPRDIHDAALYLRQYSWRHIRRELPKTVPVYGTPEFELYRQQKFFEELKRKQSKKHSADNAYYRFSYVRGRS